MNRHQQIRQTLDWLYPTLPSEVATLALAVWELKLTRESHVRIKLQLPRFIQAEMDRETDMPKFLPLKRDLLICPSCVKMYLELLAIAEWDMRDALPRPLITPPPDLSFLDTKDE